MLLQVGLKTASKLRPVVISTFSHNHSVLASGRIRREMICGQLNRASLTTRYFSDKKSSTDQSEERQDPNADGSNRNDIVLTPGQKVVAGTRLTLWAGALLFAGTCAYYIGKELLPTKMSPNTIFSRASDAVLQSKEVQNRFGEPLKVYGRDHGGHREGRRNFIEHTEYTDKDDGSKRCRVRFNLQGKFGGAFVFCEVSSDMPSGEFVYLLVQDKRNGHVITLVDNRSRLLTQRMAGGSAEGREAFENLLGARKK
jgi:import inner membrane translocase subunit TIM21